MATQYGWLVENGKSGNDLRYRTIRHGMVVWTADHNEALRFARREDAERFAAEDDDAWRIAEHAWAICRTTLSCAAPASDATGNMARCPGRRHERRVMWLFAFSLHLRHQMTHSRRSLNGHQNATRCNCEYRLALRDLFGTNHQILLQVVLLSL